MIANSMAQAETAKFQEEEDPGTRKLAKEKEEPCKKMFERSNENKEIDVSSSSSSSSGSSDSKPNKE